MSSETEYREYRVEATEDFAFDYADGPTSVYVTNDVPVGVQTLVQSAASGNSLGNIHFDVTNTPTRGISTHAYIRFPMLEFEIKQSTLTASSTAAAWLTKASNFTELALRPYGLMNLITSSMLVHINNRPINEFSNLKEIVPLLHKITDTGKQMPWLINNAGDLYQEYSDYNNIAGANLTDPLKPRLGPDNLPCYLPFVGDLETPFTLANQITRLNNRRLVPAFVETAAGVFKFKLYNVILPIPLSVFTSNTKNSKAIYGIEKLGVRFNMNPSDVRDMFSCIPGTVPSSTKIDFGAQPIEMSTSVPPELVLKIFTPPKHVEDSLKHPTLPQYVKDFTLPVMDTQLHQQIPITLNTSSVTGATISVGGSTTTQFNNIVLDHVPEYLYLQVAKTGQFGVSNKIYVPDVGCRIDKLSVNVNGTDTFTAARAIDIAQMNSRNGLTISPTHQLYTHGNSFVIIDVKKDLGIPSNVVVNQHQPLTIRVEATCTNLRIASGKVEDKFVSRLFTSSTDLLCYSKGQFKTSKFMDRLSPADYDMLKTSVKEYLLRRDANVVGAGMHGGFLGSLFKKVLPLVKKYGWSAIRGAYDGVRKQMKDDKGGMIRPSGNNIIGGLSVGSREWS